MKFSVNWLQQYLQKKLPAADKVAELLTMHSFEVDSTDQEGNDWILDVDILPNRSDCLSHFGLAREIASVSGNKIKDLKVEKIKVAKGSLKPIDLKIECPTLVPRYTACLIEGVEIGSSPQWLKDRLESIGVRSINSVVDLTNFVMLETGQPLHAFDYDKIMDQKMTLRQSKKGEKVTTLDGVERKLDDGVLVIEDKDRLIDLVGIMGGALSEISSSTKNILLQAGNFNSRAIYLATKSIGHSTEASAVYTQGIDSNLTKSTLERMLFLLKQVSEAKVVQLIDIYPKKEKDKKIKLDLERVNRLLGIKVPAAKVKSIMQNSGFGVKGSTAKLEVTVPTYRQDLIIDQDLIEEVGRVYGYDKVPAQLPNAKMEPAEINESLVYENKVKDILTGVGFSEVYNYSFIDRKILDVCKLKAAELANPVSQEQRHLRPYLAPGLVKNVKDNLRYFNQIRLFEIGVIFQLSDKDKITERKNLAGVLALGEKTKQAQEFYRLKGVIDSLLHKLRITDIWYDDQISSQSQILSIFHPLRQAEIKVGNEAIGWLGEINSKVLTLAGIKSKVAVFELNFDAIVKLATEERIYTAPSKYPSLVRDIAVLVDWGTQVSKVLNLINAAGGQLVVDVDLFDIFEGDQLPDGKKNLAFHIIYQSEEKTLAEHEVDALHQKIVKALEEEGGWEVRK